MRAVACTPPARTLTDSSTPSRTRTSSVSVGVPKIDDTYEKCQVANCANLASIRCTLMPDGFRSICRDHSISGPHKSKSHDGSHCYLNSTLSLICRRSCACAAKGGFLADQTFFCSCKGMYGCADCRVQHNLPLCSIIEVVESSDEEKNAMLAVVAHYPGLCSMLFRNQKALVRSASRERDDDEEDKATAKVWKYVNFACADARANDKKILLKEVERYVVFEGFAEASKVSAYVCKLLKCRALELVIEKGANNIEEKYVRARSSFVIKNGKMYTK